MDPSNKLRLIALFVSLLSPLSAFAQSPAPPPVKEGAKLLVSNCVEKEGARSGVTRNNRVARPTPGEAEALYYDTPFAIHVPIEVRHDGGIVRISYRVTVDWEHPPKAWSTLTHNCYPVDFGIYRTDGKQLPAGTVFYDSYGHNTDQKRWTQLVLDAEGPIPVWTFPWKFDDPNRERGSSFKVEYEPTEHVPFGKGTLRDNSFLLAPAQPGTYVFWFVIDRSDDWPEKEPKREEMKAKFYVDVLVSRGERRVGDEEAEFLFGRSKKRPADMPEDKLFLASKYEVPVVLRRNGWVFHHTEVALAKGREKWKNGRVRFNETDGYQYDLALNPQAGGANLQLALRSVKIQDAFKPIGSAEIPAEIEVEENYTWAIQFPKDVPDHSFADLFFGGGSKRQANLKARAFAHHGGDPAKAAWHVSWQPRFDRNSGTNVGAYISSVLDTEKDYGQPRSPAREEFTKQYGDDAAGWWFDDRRKYDLYQGPQEGGPPFREVVRGFPPLDQRQYITGDGGTYTLFAYEVGPWLVSAHYERLSLSKGKPSSGAMPVAGDVTVVSETDKFWEWFAGLSAVLAKEKSIADKAVADAKLETLPLQQLLKSQKRLLLSISQDATSPGVLERGAAWLDDAFPKTGIGTLPGGSEPGSVNTPVQISSTASVNLRNRLGQITEDIRRARERITDHTEAARGAYQKIVQKLEEGNDSFGGPAHPELFIWRQRYRKVYERIALEIAIESKDPAILRKALADGESAASSDQTRLLEAQLQMALGDTVGALYALRSAVTVNPQNAAAQKMLQDLECAFLKNAIDKSQGTIAEARRAFYGYMMERGFSDHVLRQGGNWPFARAMAWTEYALSKYGEVPWAIFTTGLFGSMSGLMGKPAAEADLLKTTETQMVTAFLGLNTILRLRGNGYTFEQIKKMTSSEIRYALPLRKLDGTLYSDAEAALHGVAIREAMQLPDVQALIFGDKLALQLGLEKKYWNNKDVGDTWIEWIGDATSMYNLLLFLPAAKVGGGARMSKVLWGEAELEAILAYEKSGQVISGTEFVANTVGLTQFLGAAGATDTGKAILGYLKAIGRYEESLAWYDKVVWTTGKLVGMLTINFTTVIATEKLFGHKAAMLMQAALMFGSDPEVLVKLLDSQNIPRQKVAELIINQYLPATEVHLKRLAQIEKSSFELQELFERVKAGRALSADDFVFLDKYFERDWRRLIPNGQASHDSAIALGAAAEGAKNGVNNGAGQAVAAKLKEARRAEEQATRKASEGAKQIVRKLESEPPPARGPPPPVDPPRPPRALKRATFVFQRAEKKLGAYPMPPRPRRGTECAKAEALLHLGKYHEAQAKYEEIISRILKGELFIANEMPLEYLHLKRCLAYELQGTTRKPATLSARALTRPIPPDDVERILSNPDKWRGNPQQGAIGTVYTVEGDAEYLVKTVARKTEREAVVDGVLTMQTVREVDVMADVEANLAHTELARALGFDVPAMEVRLVYDANGQVEKAFYVMRRVKGGQLADLSAGEIFLFKDELSRHRAISILLGDFDRKIDNYMVMEGRLVPIDAGLGDITGKRLRDGGFNVDEAFTMEGQAGRDHWLSRFFKDELCGRDSAGNPLGKNAPRIELWDPSESFARKGMVAEEALTYQAAKPMVDQIKRLTADEPRLKELLEEAFMKVHGNQMEIERLTQRLVDRKREVGQILDLSNAEVRAALREEVLGVIRNRVDAKVQDSLEFLRARAEKLEDCMKGLNERNGIPITYLRNHSRPHHAELAQKIIYLAMDDNVVFWRAAA